MSTCKRHITQATRVDLESTGAVSRCDKSHTYGGVGIHDHVCLQSPPCLLWLCIPIRYCCDPLCLCFTRRRAICRTSDFVPVAHSHPREQPGAAWTAPVPADAATAVRPRRVPVERCRCASDSPWRGNGSRRHLVRCPRGDESTPSHRRRPVGDHCGRRAPSVGLRDHRLAPEHGESECVRQQADPGPGVCRQLPSPGHFLQLGPFQQRRGQPTNRIAGVRSSDIPRQELRTTLDRSGKCRRESLRFVCRFAREDSVRWPAQLRRHFRCEVRRRSRVPAVDILVQERPGQQIRVSGH